MGTILIIDDDDQLRRSFEKLLKDEGYTVESAPSGEAGLKRVRASVFDLAILDMLLPGMNGLKVCRELREKKSSTPVLMLTAKGEEVDKVLGLEIGADDYMTKPFSIRELLARIKAHLRREKREIQNLPQCYAFGDSEVDFVHFKAKCRGRESELTSLEVSILKYLIAHKGVVVTREALLDKVWGYEHFPTTRTIDNHILKLRKKIEDDPSRPRHIFSIYGEGYRFME